MSVTSVRSVSQPLALADSAFWPFDLEHGLLADFSHEKHPIVLSAWSGRPIDLPADMTHFGYVFSGAATLHSASGVFDLKAGMYFSACGTAAIMGRGEGIVISTPRYKAFFQLGGPVEQTGRLNYIDGCTDSLLLPPIVKGDPCLNLLCFPPHITQTPHTHPSKRVGMVISGRGFCRTNNGLLDLTPGQVFVIPEDETHSFITQDESMRVIAYHPDSDFGATHQDHPMINRTIVEGVSAAMLPHLQTR